MMKETKYMVEKGCDEETMMKALEMAYEACFLDRTDFCRYASAIYDAMMWGRMIDSENRALKGGTK